MNLPDVNTVAAIFFGFFVLYLLGKMLVAPAKFLFRTLVNGLVGALLLLVVNLIGGFFGVSIGLNVVTALAVGFLGLPGLVMLFVLQRMLG